MTKHLLYTIPTVISSASYCSRVKHDGPPGVNSLPYRLTQNVEIRWIWAMFTLISTPYVFSFIKACWRVAFKKSRNPSWSTAAAVSERE